MAKVKGNPGSISSSSRRVSPLKPGLRGARNWASAQMRAASHTQKGFVRLVASIVAILIFVVFLGLWLGGFMPNVRQATGDFTRDRMMSMGFVIERVDVMGEGRLHEADVRKALGVYAGDYLFGVDMEGAQARVESLSWVDRAIIRRLWPDRIVVQIIERQPYALWQDEGVVQVVDVSGEVITDADPSRFTDLTLFVGEQSRFAVSEMKEMIAATPDITTRKPSFIHVSGTRWDMILNDGQIRVKLPEMGQAKALDQLSKLQMHTQILDREISVIDMRLADRLTITSSDETPA